jgi:hypothetical protein
MQKDGGGPTLCMKSRHRRHRGHRFMKVAATTPATQHCSTPADAPSQTILRPHRTASPRRNTTAAHKQPETAAHSTPAVTFARHVNGDTIANLGVDGTMAESRSIFCPLCEGKGRKPSSSFLEVPQDTLGFADQYARFVNILDPALKNLLIDLKVLDHASTRQVQRQ